MIEQMTSIYLNNRWVKFAVLSVLIIVSILVCWVSGGIPPWSWRLLLHVLPQLPALWLDKGASILPALAGLVLLSLALFFLWTVFLIAIFKVGKQCWYDLYARRRFANELREAQQLVDAVSTQDLAKELFGESIQVSREEKLQDFLEESDVAPSLRAASPAYVPNGRYPQTRRVHVPPQTSTGASARGQLRIVPSRSDDQDQPFGKSENVSVHNEIEADHNEIKAEQQEDSAASQALELDTEKESVGWDDKPVQQPSVELFRQSLPTGNALRYVSGVGLDPGVARRQSPNEDCILSLQGTRITARGPAPVGLYIVADGMGGHANGREASHLAIQTVSNAILPTLLHCSGEDPADDSDTFSELLKDSVHRANLAIYRRNRQQEHMMGTTITAVLIVDATAYIVNVGDSRTYLYRQSDGLSSLTRDHSIVARMVEDGIISPEDIYTHPKRNQIYRCLGERSTVDVDLSVVPLRTHDTLLLCSDGLWEMVRDEDMGKIIASSIAQPFNTSALLVQAALSRGGADNVGVIVVYASLA